MLEITESEKLIYNTYLRCSRFGQPVTFRKDFSDMDQNTIVNLKKISNFLTRYPHIKVMDYFYAPIGLHADDEYPKLSFFTTLAAMKNYTLFKKKQEEEDPEKQFELIKEGFKFIGMFCLENKITLEQYAKHKTGYMLSWLNHYREHRISPYCLMEINGIFSVLHELENDELELFAKNLNEKIVAFKTRYANSNKTKELVKEATIKISSFVKKNLQTK